MIHNSDNQFTLLDFVLMLMCAILFALVWYGIGKGYIP